MARYRILRSCSSDGQKRSRTFKPHLSGYEKGKDYFETLDPKTDDAIENAKALFAQQWQHEEDLRRCNPCTEVYKLVERLREIARE